jgi:hypothetical protein
VPLALYDQAPVHEAARLLGLTSDDLTAFAETASAPRIELLGSYACDAYERERSGDLIALIEKV